MNNNMQQQQQQADTDDKADNPEPTKIPEWRKQLRQFSWRKSETTNPDGMSNVNDSETKHYHHPQQLQDSDGNSQPKVPEWRTQIRSLSWRNNNNPTKPESADGMSDDMDALSFNHHQQQQQQQGNESVEPQEIPLWRKRIRNFVRRRSSRTTNDGEIMANDNQKQQDDSLPDIPPEDWKKLIRYYSSHEEIQKVGIETFEQLVEHSEIANFINWQDDVHGRTMLHCAIYQRRLDIAKLLLQHGADVNLKDQRGMTALIWAAYFGRTQMVKALLTRGARLELANAKGDTALISACRCGHAETVQILLMDGGGDGSDGMMDSLMVANDDGDTALTIAVRRGHFGIIKLLTEMDATNAMIKATDQNGDTALMVAARCGHLDMVKLLMEKGANGMIANYDGDTALSLAYHEAHDEIMDYLLSNLLLQNNNADQTTTIPVPWVKLILKRNEFQYIDTETFVKRWMEHCNLATFINWKNDFIEKGRTMLHCAIWYEREDIMILLLNHGADIEIPDKKGNTPLMYACEKGNEEMAKLLMERGANVHSRNNSGKPPLHWACSNGHLEIVRSLIDNHGANQHIQEDDEKKPPLYLYRACEGGHLEVVQFLLSRGADINIKTKQGSTPLQIASELNRPEVVWFLVRQYPWLVLEGME